MLHSAKKADQSANDLRSFLDSLGVNRGARVTAKVIRHDLGIDWFDEEEVILEPPDQDLPAWLMSTPEGEVVFVEDEERKQVTAAIEANDYLPGRPDLKPDRYPPPARPGPGKKNLRPAPTQEDRSGNRPKTAD